MFIIIIMNENWLIYEFVEVTFASKEEYSQITQQFSSGFDRI